CIIDNVDLRQMTFGRDNIYNKARKTFHATLRLVLQYKLPVPLESTLSNEIQLTQEHHLFGQDDKVVSWFQEVNNVFSRLVTNSISQPDIDDNNSDKFDISSIHEQLVKNVEPGCKVERPNMVILEAGDQPSSDESIRKTCQKYSEDLGIADRGKIDIWADQAIHQRLLKIKIDDDQLRVGLGQWHSSKAMCSVLITIFSGYGIYNCAWALGVQFLEKLESNVEYRSTCNVLEMIWASTGIAIHRYLMQRKMKIEDLMKEDNDLVKVWFLYFKWASIWKGHKIGIRT